MYYMQCILHAYNDLCMLHNRTYVLCATRYAIAHMFYALYSGITVFTIDYAKSALKMVISWGLQNTGATSISRMPISGS